MWAIFGLGNPGKAYINTRHNLGFKVMDKLASQVEVKLRKSRCGRGVVWKRSPDLDYRYREMPPTASAGRPVFLVKPLTFVNNSGKAVKKFRDKHKIPFHSLLIICDDINLPVGTIRIRKKGSAGGHHGVESIIEELGTAQFPRLRLGIRPSRFSPTKRGDLAGFVLGEFEKEEEKVVAQSIEKACQAVMTILEDGIETAMNIFNRKEKP